MRPSREKIVLGVGAVVWSERGEVLLIRRANPPRQHEWSLPGGKVEFGESLHAAVAREVLEESGLRTEILGLVTVVELIEDQAHYVLVDFLARALPGEPAAGTDASEVRWFSLADVAKIELWSETRRVIHVGAEMLGPRDC